MKKTITITILLLIVSFALIGQNKSVVKKLQITKLKNAKTLGTDSKGNVIETAPSIDTSIFQTVIDENLQTSNKTLVGAINEVNSKKYCDEVIPEVREAIPLVSNKFFNSSPQMIGTTSFTFFSGMLNINTFTENISLNEYKLYLTTSKALELIMYPTGEVYSSLGVGVHDITDYIVQLVIGGFTNNSITKKETPIYLITKQSNEITINDISFSLEKVTGGGTICSNIESNFDLIKENEKAILNSVNIYNSSGEIKMIPKEKIYTNLFHKKIEIPSQSAGNQILTIGTNSTTKTGGIINEISRGFFLYPSQFMIQTHNVDIGISTNDYDADNLQNRKVFGLNREGLVYKLDKVRWATLSIKENSFMYSTLERQGYGFSFSASTNEFLVSVPNNMFRVTGDKIFSNGVFESGSSPTQPNHLTTKKYVDEKVVEAKEIYKLNPTTTPTSAEKGMIYFDSTDNKLKCYDGTTWHNLF